MDARRVKDAEVKDKKVMIRCDLDVPLDEEGMITDDSRIRLSVATIKHLLIGGAKQVIVIGHMGRPEGSFVERLSTKRVAVKLQELLGEPVTHLEDCIDIEIPSDRIVVLENLRFHAGEEDDDEEFAKKLASNAEMFVYDAFAVSHRAHASTDAVMRFVPSYAGLNLVYEVQLLTETLENPKYPFIAIIGGAKLETKVPVIRNLLPKVDKIILGGGMVFSFLRSLDLDVGRSLVSDAAIALAEDTLKSSETKLILPEHIVVADDIDSPSEIKTVSYNAIPHGYYGLDIGKESIDEFAHILRDAKTVIWNGPMGVFEKESFAKGTEGLARYLADLDATVIVGGGDSAAAIKKLGLKDRFTHVSSGGGASLALFGGKELPAIVALERNREDIGE